MNVHTRKFLFRLGQEPNLAPWSDDFTDLHASLLGEGFKMEIVDDEDEEDDDDEDEET